MRIAMIGQKGIPATYGGIEKAVEEISSRLVTRGHDVTVFVRPHYKTTERSHRGIRIRILPSINTKHLDAISHTIFSTFYSLLAHFDVLHYHALGPSLLSFLPRLFGIPTIVTVHGLDWQRDKWNALAKGILKLGERCCVRFPKLTVSVSKTLKSYLKKKYGGNICYIPNGVESPKKIPPTTLQNHGLSGNDYILFVGRLVPEKGCHYLINAFRRIKTDMKLLIVGGTSHSSDYVENLKKLAGDDQRIVFTGYLYGDQLTEVYTNPFLFVIPSELEGLPIVLLEALSYGNCVLASDIEPNVEVLKPSQEELHGILFSNGNDGSLEDKLRQLICNPGIVDEFKVKGQYLLKDRYNWEKVVDAYEHAYAATCGLRTAVPAKSILTGK